MFHFSAIDNYIGDEGAKVIAESLKTNKSLKKNLILVCYNDILLLKRFTIYTREIKSEMKEARPLQKCLTQIIL